MRLRRVPLAVWADSLALVPEDAGARPLLRGVVLGRRITLDPLGPSVELRVDVALAGASAATLTRGARARDELTRALATLFVVEELSCLETIRVAPRRVRLTLRADATPATVFFAVSALTAALRARFGGGAQRSAVVPDSAPQSERSVRRSTTESTPGSFATP